MFDIIPIFDLRNSSPGDRLRAYERMRAYAQPAGLTELLPALDDAIALERAAVDRENLLLKDTRRSSFGPDMVDTDAKADYSAGVVYRVLKAQAEGDPEQDPLVAKAQRVLAGTFPNGLRAVTSLPYVRQVGVLEVIVNKLQTEFAPDVQDLGIAGKVQILAERTAEYRRLITAYTSDVTTADVKEARERARRHFYWVVARILTSYYIEADAAMMKHCEMLLMPVMEQDAQYRARLKARRRLKKAAAEAPAGGAESGGDEGTEGGSDEGTEGGGADVDQDGSASSDE